MTDINERVVKTTAYLDIHSNKCQRTPKGQSKRDNPEKLVTYDTQDEEKQCKNTTQHVLDTTIRKQTEITLIRQ